MCIFLTLKALLITIKYISIQSDHFEGGGQSNDETPKNLRGKMMKGFYDYVENNSRSYKYSTFLWMGLTLCLELFVIDFLSLDNL